ncbi:trypsin-like peptidase domain-containing protein [Streptomyces diastatochromogenes]|uniref:S1C family serine protease n=1 Tax=Streptomyces diastatochromogenes TaxID=42236 RepID=UPI00366A0651
MNEGNPTSVPPGEQAEHGEQPSTGETPTSPTDGDFELAKPRPAAAVSGGAGSGAAEPVAGDSAVAGAESAMAEPAGADSAVVPPAERPKPLHDPDPYSTPPYGEPGPWAPAPPVQHPAATAAQGTAVPAPGVAPGPAVSQAPAASQAPATPQAPAAAQAQAAPQAPQPSQLPAQAVPAAPGHMAPAPPAPADPGAPPSVDASVSAPGAPSVYAPGELPDSAAVAAPEPAVGPWQRYDPWAVSAAERQPLVSGPLQQTGAAVPTEHQRRKRGRRLLLVWTLLVAVVSSGIGGLAGAYVEREGVGDVHLPQPGKVPAGRAPDSVAGIAARALPSVVTLHVRGADEAGTGTGFVLDARGHILTNNHVVEPAASGGEISVTFSSGATAKGKVVGRDSGYDLAVVQVTGVHGLTPMPLGNSDDVRVGDPVVAIGAPFDLANTVTSGIISAKERPITAGGEKGDGSDVSYVDALQTDAPINPGNSGGPLLDSRARVIGINSAIRSAADGTDSGTGQAGSIGLGFAIPVNQARRVAEELINDGHATHPVIGVTLDMGYTGDGARIDTKARDGGPAVTKGGPGDRAGLRAGDVITEVDGQRVHSGEELIVKIRAHRPGDRLRLTVEHGGTREVSLVLGASDQN